MTTLSTIMLGILLFIVFPIILISYIAETKQQRIKRMRGNKWTWKKISEYYGVSPTTARRWSMA